MHGLSQRSFIKDKISGERYQDHWSSGTYLLFYLGHKNALELHLVYISSIADRDRM